MGSAPGCAACAADDKKQDKDDDGHDDDAGGELTFAALAAEAVAKEMPAELRYGGEVLGGWNS